MRKPAFCICENKDADQLRGNREADRGNREADQRLCFRCTTLLSKSEISSILPFPVAAQPHLIIPTRSETPKTGFLTTRLNFYALCKF